MKALIIAEHNNQDLNSSTLKTVTAASEIKAPYDILVAGFQCQSVADEAAKISGVENVLVLDHEVYAHGLPENLSKVIQSLASEYTHLLAPATTFGKNIMPRVAALLDVAQISDITAVISADTFVRPIYAGNALQIVQSHDPIKVITVRGSTFAAMSLSEKSATIRKLDNVIENNSTQFVGQQLTKSERPELPQARVVISGGRALKSKENFQLLESLADRLGAAIGASRAAVDAGYAPNDYQVGQTGKVVAPELYIAIGISGAIQHLAGMKDSKVIVAINKDPDAPIFQVADYGLVGDLFTIIPELNAELDKVIGKRT